MGRGLAEVFESKRRNCTLIFKSDHLLSYILFELEFICWDWRLCILFSVCIFWHKYAFRVWRLIWCIWQSSKACEGTKFAHLEGSISCHDYQEIKIQESTHVLSVGAIPRSIPVILKDDLVDIVKAGGTTFWNFRVLCSLNLSPDISD